MTQPTDRERALVEAAREAVERMARSNEHKRKMRQARRALTQYQEPSE
jgi:hypothetical protein